MNFGETMQFEEMLNKVIQGDCLEVMKQIPDGSIDLVVTDPPYGINFQSAKRIESERFEVLANDEKIDASFLKDLFTKLKEGGGLYLFTRWDVYPIWMLAVKEAGFMVKNCIVWDRMAHGMGDLDGAYAYQHDFIIFATKGRHLLKGQKRPKDILKVCRPNPNDIVHPTQKPVELIKILLNNSSKEGDTILDCFGGSGTTHIACKQLGRNCITIELNPDYCKIAEERLKAVTPRLDKFMAVKENAMSFMQEKN